MTDFTEQDLAARASSGSTSRGARSARRRPDRPRRPRRRPQRHARAGGVPRRRPDDRRRGPRHGDLRRARQARGQRRRRRSPRRGRAEPADARARADGADRRRRLPRGLRDPRPAVGRDRGAGPGAAAGAAPRAGRRRVVLHRDPAPPRLRPRLLGGRRRARRPLPVAPARPAVGRGTRASRACRGTATYAPTLDEVLAAAGRAPSDAWPAVLDGLDRRRAGTVGHLGHAVHDRRRLG